MQYIYMVSHLNPKNDDRKHIGAYPSHEEAASVVEKYKQYEGFNESPESFFIGKYEIGKLYWSEGYYSVKVKAKNKKPKEQGTELPVWFTTKLGLGNG
jgi:hypothetical protein